MALVIEDGTGKADAESYETVANARAYAAKRGRAFPATGAGGDESDGEVLMRLAMDALELRRDEYSGEKASDTQALEYPRVGSTVNGKELAKNVIPQQIKTAQIMLAIAAQNSDLVTEDASEKLSSLKVEGAVELKYADNSGEFQPRFPEVESLLDQLFDHDTEPARGCFEVVRM